MRFLICKNCFNVRGGEPIGVEDALLNAYVLGALKLTETPNAKIKRLFKIKRCLRVPDKSVILPRLWRTRTLCRLLRRLAGLTRNNNVCPQIKIVNHVIPP